MRVNADLPDITLIKKSDELKQDEISKEIQELIKNYKEPDMALTISNSETKSVQIPLVKKSEADLAPIKIIYFNTSTKKYEEFKAYDYLEHFKTYGFEWTHDELKFRYEIKLVSVQKKMTLDRLTRKMLCLDESRVWNMKMSWTKDKSAFGGRISYLAGYLENEILMKSLMGVTGSSFDFTTVTSSYKNAYLNAYVFDKSRLGKFEVFLQVMMYLKKWYSIIFLLV